jgi:hypothetical protein
VLIIWCLIFGVIGASLFAYSIIVTRRGNRRRKRRAAPAPIAMPRPMPPPPASRPLPVPAAPYQPYAQPAQPGYAQPSLPGWPGGQLPTGPTAGGVTLGRGQVPRNRALPPGPRPLALPSTPHQGPYDPYLPPQPALPSGPVAGTGYPATGTTYGTGAVYGGELPALTAGPAVASGPPAPSTYGTPATYGTDATTYGSTYGTSPAAEIPEQRSSRGAKAARSGKRDDCATLRAECEQLRVIAAQAATAATQAAAEAEAAHNEYVAAQRTADDARRALQQIVRDSVELATALSSLEKTALTPQQQQLQTEVRDAAFAAYRRGDISSDQMREVFKRAEGWTPEHDRLSKRATEVRAEETELTRLRDNAVLAEETAAERARTTANAARLLDEQSRTAAADARGRCAAADACEQRTRRR